MLKEFQEFIAKGNVLDLAVAVVIGKAFGDIVTSLVENIITPATTPLLGKADFSKLTMGPFLVGKFINSVISFLIIAFIVFLIVKAFNHARNRLNLMQPKPEAEAGPDANTTMIAQNEKIIELLERVASKP